MILYLLCSRYISKAVTGANSNLLFELSEKKRLRRTTMEQFKISNDYISISFWGLRMNIISAMLIELMSIKSWWFQQIPSIHPSENAVNLSTLCTTPLNRTESNLTEPNGTEHHSIEMNQSASASHSLLFFYATIIILQRRELTFSQGCTVYLVFFCWLSTCGEGGFCGF